MYILSGLGRGGFRGVVIGSFFQIDFQFLRVLDWVLLVPGRYTGDGDPGYTISPDRLNEIRHKITSFLDLLYKYD
jgi:hypothetical protein